MSFLSKFGNAFKVIYKGIQPVAGTIGQIVPGPDPFEAVSNVILAAEAVGTIVKAQAGSKLEKFPLVLEQAKEVFRNSELLAGREIADEGAYSAAVAKIVQGVYEILQLRGVLKLGQ